MSVNREMSTRGYWEGAGVRKTFTAPMGGVGEALDPPKGWVLDLGCGYGRTLRYLVEQGEDALLGIDFSLNLLRRGRRNGLTVPLCAADALHLPLPDRSCSRILMLGFLTTLVHEPVLVGVMEEVGRVANAGAVLEIRDFLINPDERNQKRYREGMAEGFPRGAFRLPDGGMVRHFTLGRLHELVASWETREERTEWFETMNGNRGRGWVCTGPKKTG